MFFCLIFYKGMLGLWELLLVFGGILVGSIQAVFSFYNNFRRVQLAFLTPPFLGGISAEVCEIRPHNSDFLYFFGRIREGSSELIELSRINKVSFGLQYFTSQTNLFILRSTNTKLHNYTSAPYIHIASAVNSYSV
jgi:hypothetical protein